MERLVCSGRSFSFAPVLYCMLGRKYSLKKYQNNLKGQCHEIIFYLYFCAYDILSRSLINRLKLLKQKQHQQSALCSRRYQIADFKICVSSQSKSILTLCPQSTTTPPTLTTRKHNFLTLYIFFYDRDSVQSMTTRTSCQHKQ